MRRLVFGLVVSAACATASAQQPPPPGLPSPRLQSAFPPGAQAGSASKTTSMLDVPVRVTNVVTVTGADLDEPTGLLFSHPGIKAEYIEPPAPKAAADPKKKDAPPAMAKAAAPSAGPHKFKLTVAPDVPHGTYDVRFVGKWGVSNPRAFVVGSLPEVNEKESNNDVPDAQRIPIGTTVNGVIQNQADVDYTVFAAKKGQRVIVSCAASSIDSKVRPMIEIYDTTGRKLAANRNYRDADAVADFTAPADGDYYARLFEFTYQTGSADHFYRLTVSAGPWIDAVFPTAVEPGKASQVTLYGRNLPGSSPADGFLVDGRPLEKLVVTVTPPADPLASQRLKVSGRVEPAGALQDGFEYRLKGPAGESNAVPIYFARDKVVVKKNPGGTKPETAEALPTPCEVAGMIAKRGDRDWYSFDAKKGEPVFLELTAERNGSPADFYFSVHNPQAKNDMMGAEQDDDNEMLHPTGFYTRSGDPPTYRFVPPQDGKYLVGVGARESGFLYGPRTSYRLRVGPAKPDFRAVVMPFSRTYQTGSAARQDGTEAFDVFVHRIDGFAGPVTVTAENLPGGVTAKPTLIGPGAKWGTLVLNVAGNAAAFTGPIGVKASSTLPDGKPLVREVRPASVTWGLDTRQNNVPVVSRLNQSLVLAVRPEKAFFTLAPDLTGALLKLPGGKDEKVAGGLALKQGEKATVPVKVNWVSADKQAVVLTAEPMTQNQQNSPLTATFAGQPTKDKPEAVVNLDVRTNAVPGTYTVVIRGEAQVPFVREGGPKGKGGNVPVSALTNAIEVTIVPKELAKVTPAAVPNNQLKAGTTTEVSVKVERLFDYAGEFKLTFVPAKDAAATGVTAEAVTIPAGKDEAKLSLATAKDAKAGALPGTLVVTAVYGGKYTVTHETKVTYTVVAAPPVKDKKK